MRIPLTKYGWPQVVVAPVAILVAMIIIALCAIIMLPLWIAALIELPLTGLLILSLAFFRDPHRDCPKDSNLLLSPADGRITEIETIDGNEFIGEKGLKIGIFLSIFNTHINRAPCNVKIAKIKYKKGQYKNAMNPESGRVNESNELKLVRTDSPGDKLIVKQISGAIARRIVCKTSQGKELAAGEKFGMIKFGSRTELYVPVSASISNNRTSLGKSDSSQAEAGTNSDSLCQEYEVKCLVKIGDKVKAGLTPLVRYEKCRE